jgi:hypothetical protein
MFRTRASGETDPMSEREKTQRRREHQVSPNQPTTQRGADDRRGEVRPKDDPAPRSPAPDRDAVEKGERILERVKPY